MAQKRCDHGKVVCPQCAQMQDLEREFEEGVKRELFPKVESSGTMMSLVGSNEPDVKMCVEMGAALMFDKPIFGVLLPGAEANENLRRVCVDWFDYHAMQTDSDEAERLGQATKEWAEKPQGERFPKTVPWAVVTAIVISELQDWFDAEDPEDKLEIDQPVGTTSIEWSMEELAKGIVRKLAMQGFGVDTSGVRSYIPDDEELGG